MLHLFATEAAERRLQLARALEGVVDRAGADALKKSLSAGNVPLTDSERRLLVQLRPPRATFEAVSAADLPAIPGARASRPPGSSPWVGLVLAGGALFFVKMTGTSAASDEPKAVGRREPGPLAGIFAARGIAERRDRAARRLLRPAHRTAGWPHVRRVPTAAPPRASRVRPAAPNGPSAPRFAFAPPRPEIDTRAF